MNRYLEKCAEITKKDVGEGAGIAVGTHIVQNITTNHALKSPHTYKELSESFLRGAHGMHANNASVGKNVYRGMFTPEIGTLHAEAHKAGQHLTHVAKEGKMTFGDKRKLATMRMVGRGEIVKAHKLGARHLDSVPGLKEKLDTKEKAHQAEELYHKHYDHPALQKVREVANSSKEHLKSTGRAGHAGHQMMFGALVPSLAGDVVTPAISAGKLLASHPAIDHIKPLKALRDSAVKHLGIKPAVHEFKAGLKGEHINEKTNKIKQYLVSPMGAHVDRLSNEAGHVARKEGTKQLVRSLKNNDHVQKGAGILAEHAKELFGKLKK